MEEYKLHCRLRVQTILATDESGAQGEGVGGKEEVIMNSAVCCVI